MNVLKMALLIQNLQRSCQIGQFLPSGGDALGDCATNRAIYVLYVEVICDTLVF